MLLPEFQRGYVWNRDQVRGLMRSLYRGYPVGGLLTWDTETDGASVRGSAASGPGSRQLLLDGQQRVTSLYGVVRGRPPAFFEGDASAFTGLRFHVEDEIFEFYAPAKMKDDPLWIDLTELFTAGQAQQFGKLTARPELMERFPVYVERLARLHGLLQFADALRASVKYVGRFLDTVAGRLGLDHDRVLMGRYAFPVVSRFLHLNGGRFTDGTQTGRMLYWYVQAALWGRFAGSTETVLAQDYCRVTG
jgi:hypothetical protein